MNPLKLLNSDKKTKSPEEAYHMVSHLMAMDRIDSPEFQIAHQSLIRARKQALKELRTHLFAELDHSMNIVSVGSGKARVERRLIEAGYKVTCIDDKPDRPDLHHKGPTKVVPAYPTVTDYLVSSKPHTDCLILWNPRSNMVDYQAIQLLQPSKIIIAYDKFGSSGSQALHTFLYRTKIGDQDSGIGLTVSGSTPYRKVEGMLAIEIKIRPAAYQARWVPGAILDPEAKATGPHHMGLGILTVSQ